MCGTFVESKGVAEIERLNDLSSTVDDIQSRRTENSHQHRLKEDPLVIIEVRKTQREGRSILHVSHRWNGHVMRLKLLEPPQFCAVTRPFVGQTARQMLWSQILPQVRAEWAFRLLLPIDSGEHRGICYVLPGNRALVARNTSSVQTPSCSQAYSSQCTTEEMLYSCQCKLL